MVFVFEANIWFVPVGSAVLRMAAKKKSEAFPLISKAMHNRSEQVFFIRLRALGWNRLDRIATINRLHELQAFFPLRNPRG